ncbi:MAG: alpha/beta hydrolase [Deltaproteobacteria bacterium]|nr:alpha/beta hydrolase [Deltaproteobacteria bacterium]
MEPRDKYVRINGLRLHYLEWGRRTKPLMLLLHGLTSHARIWDDVAAAFNGKYHIIALDQRGHGESQWSEEMAYGIEDHFSDIAAFIEQLDPEHLTILGHSMGGRNALFYAACRPERIERLIAVDARPGNNPVSSETLRIHLTRLPLEAASYEQIASDVGYLYPTLGADVIFHIVRHGYNRLTDGRLVPKFDIRMAASLESAGYAAVDLWQYLEHIFCPTLVIRGQDSTFLTAEDARRMCRLLPNARLEEIPESTHMPAHENPAFFNRAVSEFLDTP